MQIAILCKETTARVSYTFHLVFNEILGLKYEVFTEVDAFKSSNLIKVSYQNEVFDEAIFSIPNSGLLFESEIREQALNPSVTEDVPIIFSDLKSHFSFDVFAAIFYMASRYEEYLPHQVDAFNRYTPEQSIACKQNFLDKPVCHIWADLFYADLCKKFGEIRRERSQFEHVVSVDVDVAFAFKGRNFIHQIGSTLKDVLNLNFTRLAGRFNVLSNLAEDPFHCLPLLLELRKSNNFRLAFFMLVGNYSDSKVDNALSSQQNSVRNLAQNLAQNGILGLHPSVKSNKNYKLFFQEKEELEQASNSKITCSRQHFISFTLPETYRQLIKAGIRDDYSMGYAQMSGFRSGMCKPFLWFDLAENKSTSLILHPFAFMDATYNFYLKTHPDLALEDMLKLTEHVAKYGGTLYSVWHNDTFSQMHHWKQWGNVLSRFFSAFAKQISITEN